MGKASKSTFKILLLPGDGIGTEVLQEAEKVLKTVEETTDIKFEIEKELIGGASIDDRGVPIVDSVLRMAKKSDSVLLGAVGGYKWDTLPISKRPEQALLSLRYELGVWANLRPVKIFAPLVGISPLKPDIILGMDILIVRELTGDAYFGKPRYKKEKDAKNTIKYTRKEVERIARLAFDLSLKRSKKLTSVDKANILEVYSFWRDIVNEIAKQEQYKTVNLEHMFIDTFAMRLITHPRKFDVVLSSNMFGDIISDEGGGIIGSLGLCPSASLGDTKRGLYEPVHGSAPDIAGKGIANPIGAILSVSSMLRYSFDEEEKAVLIERAVEEVLKEGKRTPDISTDGKEEIVSTKKFGDAVISKIKTMI